MEQRRFHNALRILLNIEWQEVNTFMSLAMYQRMQCDPHDFYIRAGDELEDKLWALIESRQPKKERA